MADKIDPDKASSAYSSMMADWQLIRDVQGGARRIREKRETYLPKFAAEGEEDYNARVQFAPWSAHYEDSTRSLIGKPFSKEVKLQGQISSEVAAWAENVDLAGTNLHNFAKKWFSEALHMGSCFCLVDYPQLAGRVVTRADEQALGARPYFRLIPVDQMRAIYTGTRNGRTYVRQIRFVDDTVELADMEEVAIQRRRVIDDINGVITQRVFKKVESGDWELVAEESGDLVGVTEIPVVALIFGAEGDFAFAVRPTMIDLANKQIEHYRHGNRIDQVFDYAGFPMLQAEGMKPPVEQYIDDNGVVKTRPGAIETGPRAVLFAPPSQAGDRPKWGWIEPSSQSIEQLREHGKDIESEMRTLGLQPHMPSVGIQNMAATTSAINAARTHSTLQAWAFMLKDALEQGFVYAHMWKGMTPTTEVFVHTDFSAEVLGDADEKGLREDVSMGLISWDTYVDEMSRRGIYGPQFDKNAERERLASGDGGAPGGGLNMPTDPLDPEGTGSEPGARDNTPGNGVGAQGGQGA